MNGRGQHGAVAVVVPFLSPLVGVYIQDIDLFM